MRHRFLAALGFALTVAPAVAQPPAQRYELGRRLRAFEAALEQQTDDAVRKKAIAPLGPLTFTYFSGQFGEAGRMLDDARFALTSKEFPDAATRWAESLAVQLGPRFVGPDVELPVKLAAFYKTTATQPERAKVRLRLTVESADGKPIGTLTRTFDVTNLPLEAKWLLERVPAGDHFVRAEVVVDGTVKAVSRLGLSVAEKLPERMAKLEEAAKALEAKGTDERTVKKLAAMLAGLRKEPAEMDYPAARLLAEAEEAAKAIEAGKASFGNGKVGQFWLTVPAGAASKAVRLQAPEAAKKGKPLPLVLALHGAGGSENLFFEGYGNGLVAKLCAERGWLLVAPNYGATAALIDEVDKLYPIDRKKVFVVGHSLGAAQTMSLVSQSPDKFAAAAVLGGSALVTRSDALKALPVFVGIGDGDFGLSGAKGLRKSLEAAELKTVEYREYAGVEHLTVVQLSLRDVFAFFDKFAK